MAMSMGGPTPGTGMPGAMGPQLDSFAKQKKPLDLWLTLGPGPPM